MLRDRGQAADAPTPRVMLLEAEPAGSRHGPGETLTAVCFPLRSLLRRTAGEAFAERLADRGTNTEGRPSP